MFDIKKFLIESRVTAASKLEGQHELPLGRGSVDYEHLIDAANRQRLKVYGGDSPPVATVLSMVLKDRNAAKRYTAELSRAFKNNQDQQARVKIHTKYAKYTAELLKTKLSPEEIKYLFQTMGRIEHLENMMR